MPREARKIDSSLCNKGFRSHDGDHKYYYLFVNGTKTSIRTKISHGEKEVDDNLISLMARQVKLTRQLFLGLVDCPLSSEEYIGLLRKSGHIE